MRDEVPDVCVRYSDPIPPGVTVMKVAMNALTTTALLTAAAPCLAQNGLREMLQPQLGTLWATATPDFKEGELYGNW